MRRAAVLLTLALASAARAEDDASAENDARGRAFVEISTDRTTRFAGEKFRVALRIGFDETFFRERAIAMFRRPLDLRVHVDAPWFDALPTATPVPAGDDERAETVTLAVNDAVVAAARVAPVVRDGRSFQVVEVVRDFLLDAARPVALAAPSLRFAWATRFEDDLVGGDVPLDRHDVSVTGTPAALTILPLPGAERPPEFTGAVGRFRVEAGAHPRVVDAGESIRLTLTVEGDGDLTKFEAPRFEDVPGLHVYGLLDDRRADRRTFSWDVAPLTAEARELPGVAFAFFDPEPPGAWRVVRTEPVRIEVRGPPAPPSATDERLAANETRRSDEYGECFVWVLPILCVAIALVASAIARMRRRRAKAATFHPDVARLRAALEGLRSPATESLDALAAAFTEYLGARLRCPAAAVVTPDLASRLRAAGVPAPLAAQVAALSERLVGARYGASGESAPRPEEVRSLAEALERCLGGPPATH